MSNIRTYKKMIKGLKSGDVFYFNAIGGTSSMIEYTRKLIKDGVIKPESHELDRTIKTEVQYRYYSGESIAPQMNYEVI